MSIFDANVCLESFNDVIDIADVTDGVLVVLNEEGVKNPGQNHGGRKRFSGSRIFDRFSHRFTRNLLLKALKILIVGYFMLKIIMTHYLPGFKNEPQSKYHFFKCFL